MTALGTALLLNGYWPLQLILYGFVYKNTAKPRPLTGKIAKGYVVIGMMAAVVSGLRCVVRHPSQPPRSPSSHATASTSGRCKLQQSSARVVSLTTSSLPLSSPSGHQLHARVGLRDHLDRRPPDQHSALPLRLEEAVCALAVPSPGTIHVIPILHFSPDSCPFMTNSFPGVGTCRSSSRYQFYAFHYTKTSYMYINQGEFGNKMQKMSRCAVFWSASARRRPTRRTDPATAQHIRRQWALCKSQATVLGPFCAGMSWIFCDRLLVIAATRAPASTTGLPTSSHRSSPRCSLRAILCSGSSSCPRTRRTQCWPSVK